MSRLIIRVECPHCSFQQNTETIKTIRCQACNKQYDIYPVNEKSRIIKIIKGDIQLLLREWYKEYGHIKMKKKRGW